MIFTPDAYDLLTSATQARADLPALAERAEARVLAYYTEDGTVRLTGYDPDACEEGLQRALQLEIAGVVEHMAAAPDPNVASVTRGDRTVRFETRRSRLPLSFGAYLQPYDARSSLYRI